MTRSIVGRFLILAVLLVSLGVIAQAALIITKGSGKAVAKANPAPVAAPNAVAALAATPAPATPADGASAVPSADAAPIRVVYPGPLGDTPVQPRKFAAAAPATPVAAPQPAPAQPVPAAVAAAQPVPAVTPSPAVAAAPAPAKPAPVVVASAEADTQPTADAAGKGGVNLNSASVDVLNHLGGGHIGQTIVKHRPYSSVEDLVRKRVVRRSVYEQIKDQVAAQ